MFAKRRKASAQTILDQWLQVAISAPSSRSALACLSQKWSASLPAPGPSLRLDPNLAGGSLNERHPKELGSSGNSASCTVIVVWSIGPNTAPRLKRMRYSRKHRDNRHSEC